VVVAYRRLALRARFPPIVEEVDHRRDNEDDEHPEDDGRHGPEAIDVLGAVAANPFGIGPEGTAIS
jgi:hypothetical protein